MQPPALRTCLLGARLAALTVGSIGLCGLLGWTLDSQTLKGVFPGGVTIKANAAIALCLAGTALWLLQEGTRRPWRRIGRVAAVLAALLGGATLFQHITGRDLGIDQLLFTEAPGQPGTMSPGRMGPPASIALLLAGGALLLLRAPGRRQSASFQALAIAVCVVAVIPLIGYAHQANDLYRLARYTGIALHTAVALLALGLGILLSRPTVGLTAAICRADAGGVLSRRLILPALLLPFLAGWLRWAADRVGVLDPGITRALLVVFLTASAVVLILLCARRLSELDRQRGRNERALRAGEARLRIVTENAHVLLANLDRDLRHVFVNTSYARRFGRTVEEVLGAPIHAVVGDAVFARLVRPLQRALAGERVECEVELEQPGEEPRWLHASCTPETSSEGGTVGLVLVIADVTDRRRSEREVERARDRALAASRAKDAFIAMLSHELRTPLSPVLLIAGEGEVDPHLSEQTRQDFATIRRHIEQEARLIDDLLDLSRITRGKLNLALTELDAAEVLRGALQAVAADAQAKGLLFEARIAPEPAYLHGDAVRLQQVIWNVLKNAIKFTPAGGAVWIKAEPEADREGWLIQVSDTGIGMTAGELAQAFEPFVQGEHGAQSQPNAFGGLGLGLAISRHLVNLHGGTIAAHSPGRGGGTTVRIRLPLLPKRAAKPADSAPRVRPHLRAGLRILVAEDHPATQQALAALLHRRHCTVRTAATVAEALEWAASEPFDLVISDLGLPDGDGCSLMSKLKSRHGLCGIALTGYGMEDDIARTTAAGFVAHLTKPVTIEALEAVLATALPIPTPPVPAQPSVG